MVPGSVLGKSKKQPNFIPKDSYSMVGKLLV